MKKTLKYVLNGVNILNIIGKYDNKSINGICINSKNVKSNTIFIANKGINTNGNLFIKQAIYNGASVIVCEKHPLFIYKNITYVIVHDSKEALGIISSNFYNNPTKKINLIGITGTNGKTSVAVILHQLFSNLGEKNILISTIGIKISSKIYYTEYTTPNIIEINKYLNLSIKKGCKYAFMEVSSHGIDQKRISGLFFKVGIFTNITHDHLDYHKSFNDYLFVKQQFFNQLTKKSFSIINIDDKNYSKIIEGSVNKIYFYGINNKNADFKIKILNKSFNGTKILINNKNKININFIGKFNAYNVLASYAASVLLGMNYKIILKNLSLLHPVMGRCEQYVSKCGKRIIIDYAHNPNGLKNVINSIKEIIKNININLICVIGCGGNRDISKRSIMGKIVNEMCNISIFTSDNPRKENPLNIIMDMKKLLSIKEKKSIITFIDRKTAIHYAIKLSNKGDIILIMGKGHENFQEINGINYPFNDMKIVKNFLEKNND
ncbi:UDP-N-acetylmuramoyl-L-alanyl-D-glutamate--2,6-diaminopimelate ligase [Blattabacterium cuenoti]|uniref:UDP-N-acetylmuramoyl-L-alanyl-D-glutamate--2, 6-diaminopimelate ligase n=1 Tax=Blattabacterium cuenoti TaxID=1653831 RepID=UPI00163D37C8|nr:UDP-N-acetylmuramoyl-L-alanyl-D-glutamate--2,6-diaminopimelate ligase [Blattabacterium cuenoti]